MIGPFKFKVIGTISYIAVATNRNGTTRESNEVVTLLQNGFEKRKARYSCYQLKNQPEIIHWLAGGQSPQGTVFVSPTT